jgi:hypothetical protein
MSIRALEQAHSAFCSKWHAEAFIEAQAIATLLQEVSRADGFAEHMRPELLRHARKLVAVLQGDAPVASGKVLRFARKQR